MKVLDLQCTHQHVFEGWFGSEDDFQSQLVRGLVSCPLCGDSQIVKKLSAPRLNLGAVAVPTPVASESAARVATTPGGEAAMQLAWLKMVHHVLANTEDVGSQFAEEARKIHYGERPEGNIRGQASAAETEALLDEGIDVMPLPLPTALKGRLQ